VTRGGDTTAVARALRPTAPAYAALAGCVAVTVTALLLPWPVAFIPLVWVLLGITAGYSISGSV
jgi:hypothetical protein